MRKIRRIICHWVGDVSSNDYLGARARDRIRNDHIDNRGYRDIGYHYLIDRDGLLLSGREDQHPGAHAGPIANQHSIGVCFLYGSFDKQLTEQTLRTAGALFRDLSETYDFELLRGETVIGHQEVGGYWGRTECPGFILGELDEIIDRAIGENPEQSFHKISEEIISDKRGDVFKSYVHTKGEKFSVIHNGKELKTSNVIYHVDHRGPHFVINGRTFCLNWLRLEAGFLPNKKSRV